MTCTMCHLTGRDGNTTTTTDESRPSETPENECSCSSLGSPHCHVDAHCCILNTENEPLWLSPKLSIHVFEVLLIVFTVLIYNFYNK